MQIIDNPTDLLYEIKKIKKTKEKIAFIPTMGALHAGHLSLFNTAAKKANVIVCSIFVNPLQFDKKNDFIKYPKTLTQDIAKLEKHKIDILYTPSLKHIYPRGLSNITKINEPTLTNILCGASRPGHFEGVCTVVTILCNQVQADFLILGEKDYQQLQIIRKMMKDLSSHVMVITSPTKRNKYNLALSSRNKLLNKKQLKKATLLYKSLLQVKNSVDKKKEIKKIKGHLKINNIKLDYLEIRDGDTLQNTIDAKTHKNSRIFIAVYLDNVRLIDNIVI
jgi:pantoate--beta-alanine ligase